MTFPYRIVPWRWAPPAKSPPQWTGRFPTRSACSAVGKWQRSTARQCFPTANASPLTARRSGRRRGEGLGNQTAGANANGEGTGAAWVPMPHGVLGVLRSTKTPTYQHIVAVKIVSYSARARLLIGEGGGR